MKRPGILNRLWNRNFLLDALVRRRHGPGLRCCGRVQWSVDPLAELALAGRNFVGVPLLGQATDARARTVVSFGPGSRVRFEEVLVGRGCAISTGPGAALTIGFGSYITDSSKIYASDSVTIGQNCAISYGVTMLDDDGHGLGPPPYSAPILIGDDVWIGCNVTVLKGVTIGAGSAVAAGAVVTKSCPPKSLLGGVPARVLREDIDWTDAFRHNKS